MKKQSNKKIKRRKMNLIGFTFVFAILSVSFYLFCTLFVQTQNNTLSAKKQSIEREIAQVETQNDALKVEIQTLSTRERVDNIASENGLSLNQDNIVTIAVNGGD